MVGLVTVFPPTLIPELESYRESELRLELPQSHIDRQTSYVCAAHKMPAATKSSYYQITQHVKLEGNSLPPGSLHIPLKRTRQSVIPAAHPVHVPCRRQKNWLFILQQPLFQASHEKWYQTLVGKQRNNLENIS